MSQLKKKAAEEKAIIVHDDEASFRQTPTVHQTWAPRNCQQKIPSNGERNTQKIIGAISLNPVKFVYQHTSQYFNVTSYVGFLENYLLPGFYRKGHRIYLVQDNASYHKAPETYAWFEKNRKYLEVFQLPPYSPEYNATERIWQYTRKSATHNKYFDTPKALCDAIFYTFNDIQEHPEKVAGLVQPFF